MRHVSKWASRLILLVEAKILEFVVHVFFFLDAISIPPFHLLLI